MRVELHKESILTICELEIKVEQAAPQHVKRAELLIHLLGLLIFGGRRFLYSDRLALFTFLLQFLDGKSIVYIYSFFAFLFWLLFQYRHSLKKLMQIGL